MAYTIDSKSKAVPSKRPADRLCAHCRRTKLETDFYSNRQWTEQKGRDLWCKDCASKCITKEDVKEYFWENNREWEDTIWDKAKAKALSILKTNTTYQQSAEDRRAALLERCTAQELWAAYPTGMKYCNNSQNGYMPYAQAVKSGFLKEDGLDDEKEYDDFFNGFFTSRDIKYMYDYYNALDGDFALDNESLRDYARKAARASLHVDKMQDDYAAGRCSFADVKDAITVFDTLMKSANFAACKRKTPENSGQTSWSEAAFLLETTGHTMQRKITWDEDDVDKNLRHVQHIVAAMTAEGG